MFVAYRNPTKVGWLGWFEDDKGESIAFVGLDGRVVFLHRHDGRSCDYGVQWGEHIPPKIGMDEEVGGRVPGIMPVAEMSEETDEREANPPLVKIYNDRSCRANLPPLGLSAKWEMPPLRELSSDDWGKFVEMMYGIVAKVGTERLADR